MKPTRFAQESAAQAQVIRHFRITYKQDNAPVSVISAHMMKYDSGVALLIRKTDSDSRVVAAINTDSIREIVEVESGIAEGRPLAS